MNKNRLIASLFLVFAILFTTCKESKDKICNSPHPGISFILIEEIKLAVQNLEFLHENTFLLEKDSVSQYWALNKGINAFDIFDLNQRSYLRRLKLSQNFTEIKDFFVHQPDSIYVYAELETYSTMALINSDGQILNSWLFSEQLPDGRDTFMLYANSRTKFNLNPQHNSATLYVIPYEEPYSIRSSKFPFIIEYDLTAKKYGKLFGEYPINYHNKKASPFDDDFPFISTQNYYILTFPSSHYIFCYDKHNLNKKEIYAKSNYLVEESELLPRENEDDWKSRNAFHRTKGQYVNILFDKYQNLIYRIVKHSQPNKNEKGKLNTITTAPWSIMVLNTELKIIGEAKFPTDKYDFENILVSKKGLLLSRKNSSDSGSDYLFFDLIKLKTNE